MSWNPRRAQRRSTHEPPAMRAAADGPFAGAGIQSRTGSRGVAQGGLEDLVADSMEVRSLRKGSMYDPIIVGPEERDSALRWMCRTLPAIRSALIRCDPELEAMLRTYQPG